MAAPTVDSQCDENGEVERIRRKIEDAVSRAFAKGSQAYYLSQLGADLGEDRKLLERLTGQKFASFIETSFGFDIGHAGVHGNVLYIKNNQVPESSPVSSPPRYKPKFWAAFAVPISSDERRHINIETLEFGTDKDLLLQVGGEVREIDSSFIARENEEDSPQKILDRISSWLSEQGLAGTRFVKSRARSRGDQGSVLDQMIGMLSPDQLRRVSLPLDVIKSLSDR